MSISSERPSSGLDRSLEKHAQSVRRTWELLSYLVDHFGSTSFAKIGIFVNLNVVNIDNWDNVLLMLANAMFILMVSLLSIYYSKYIFK